MMRLSIALGTALFCFLAATSQEHLVQRDSGPLWASVALDEGDTRDEKQGDGPPPVVPPIRPPKLLGQQLG